MTMQRNERIKILTKNREQLQKRIESLQQQNRVLNVELETYKLRVKSLQVSSCDQSRLQKLLRFLIDLTYFRRKISL